MFIYKKSEDFLVSLQPAQREAIRQNAQRIKTLGLVQSETVLVGCETCTQLEEIYFFGLLAVDRYQDEVELRDQAGSMRKKRKKEQQIVNWMSRQHRISLLRIHGFKRSTFSTLRS